MVLRHSFKNVCLLIYLGSDVLNLEIVATSRCAWHPTPVLGAWKLPWMEEPGGLQSMGSRRVRHD